MRRKRWSLVSPRRILRKGRLPNLMGRAAILAPLSSGTVQAVTPASKMKAMLQE